MERATLDYIDRGRHTVPGWFERLDAFLFAAVDDAQKAADVTGGLMEIGTYMGRCAVLLGYLQRPGERLVVCDLFDGRPVNQENEAERERWYTDLTRQAFEANFRRFHARLPDEVVSGPSSLLHERVPELEHAFRIIHIDGSHEYAAVQSDIRLSRQLLAEGGVVIFDDVNSRHTPGVAAAVWSAVVDEGLIPHFVTTKLYASWGPIPPVSLSLLSNDWTSEPHTVAGSPLVHLEERGSARQRMRGWIPPVLLPQANSLNQRLVELTGAARRALSWR